MVLTVHRWFANKACPGDWMMARMGDLAGKVTAQLGGSCGMQASELKGLPETEVVRRVGSLFTADQKRSGILACVSMAQFILESGYGSMDLAQNANNCFGMKKVLSGNTWPGSTWDGKSIYTKKTKEDDGNGNLYTITADFRKYPCIEDSIADHSAYLLGAKNGSKPRYEGLKGCTDYRKTIRIIKDGGYATDTKYVSKICSIIERWNLSQYDLVENWYRVRKSWADEASQIGAFTILANAKAAADANPGYSVFDQNGKKVYTPPTDADLPEPPFMVKVSTDGTEIYTGPGTNYPKTGQSTGEGIFTIMEISSGPGSFLGWGRLKSGAGWIALDDVRPI